MMHPLGHIPQSIAAGGKARGLDRLIKLGYSVPPGFILDKGETKKNGWQNELDEALAQINVPAYAVRSSGQNEDGKTCSLAGEFVSRTKVTRKGVSQAIHEVIAQAQKVAPKKEFCVIVQKWIQGDCSGVAFSRHPTRALGEVTVIDGVRGTAEALVSGRVQAKRAFGWEDVALIPKGYPCDQRIVHELERSARAIEDDFGCPVDLEWTVARGIVYLLQARPMTVVPEPAIEEADEGRVMRLYAEDHELRLDRSVMAESLPRPSRASLDLVRHIFRRGGPFAKIAAELGLRLNPGGAERYFVPVMGHLYVDEREAPFLPPGGVWKSLRTAIKTGRAIKQFPLDFYRAPWKTHRQPRGIEEALELLDGAAGLNYARATILARVASLGPPSRGDVERLWGLRQAWLKQRPIKIASQDFELTVIGKQRERALWSKPARLSEAYAILREDAKDEIRPILAHLAAWVENADAPLCKAKLTEADRALAKQWKALRLRAREFHLPSVIEWQDLFDLRGAARKNTKAKGAMYGQGVSPGRGEGRVTIGGEPGAVSAGSILVLDSLTPEWFPFLSSGVNGLVTETGSGLSHGAIQCRERGIPAVFGVEDVLARLKGKEKKLRVDGESGEVR